MLHPPTFEPKPIPPHKSITTISRDHASHIWGPFNLFLSFEKNLKYTLESHNIPCIVQSECHNKILNIQNHAVENAAVSVVFWVAFGL